MTEEQIKKMSQDLANLFANVARITINANPNNKITQEEALCLYMTTSYLFLRKQATEYINNLLESDQSHDKVKSVISQIAASPDWVNIFFIDELMLMADKHFENKYNQLRPPRP